MSAWLEDAGDGRYRGIYGDPNGFGTEVFFDSQEEALAWGNTNGSAAFLTVIAAAIGESETPILVEGHTRATAYVRALDPDDEIEVIVGYSPNLDNWHFF